VKSTTSKISDATKTVSVKKPPAKPEVKKRELKKNSKKNSSSSSPFSDDSEYLSDISDFEETKEVKVVLKGSSTRGKIVELNPKIKKEAVVPKKRVIDEDKDMSSEEEVINKHVPSRRRGVSEPATVSEPVKVSGKRKRALDDESENEYDPEPKRAKNDDKEEKG
jgi:hypothetical protein